MYHILEWTLPLLPDERPRHLLGIGHVRDIFESVERGIDLFDCVIPTREARHRVLYTVTGRVHVKISRVTNDIIDTRPGSPTLKDGVTFRQLALWFQAHDIRALKYATLHNIFFYTQLMKEIRQSIENKTFLRLKESYLRYY
jgi:queuine tRNA-ribosyltransferase